jgi:hypothetical protein
VNLKALRPMHSLKGVTKRESINQIKNLKRRETLQRYIRSTSDELNKLRRNLKEPTNNEKSCTKNKKSST